MGKLTATYSYLANSLLMQQIAFQNGGTTRMTTTKKQAYTFDDIGNRLRTKTGVQLNSENPHGILGLL